MPKDGHKISKGLIMPTLLTPCASGTRLIAKRLDRGETHSPLNTFAIVWKNKTYMQIWHDGTDNLPWGAFCEENKPTHNMCSTECLLWMRFYLSPIGAKK